MKNLSMKQLLEGYNGHFPMPEGSYVTTTRFYVIFDYAAGANAAKQYLSLHIQAAVTPISGLINTKILESREKHVIKRKFGRDTMIKQGVLYIRITKDFFSQESIIKEVTSYFKSNLYLK